MSSPAGGGVSAAGEGVQGRAVPGSPPAPSARRGDSRAPHAALHRQAAAPRAAHPVGGADAGVRAGAGRAGRPDHRRPRRPGEPGGARSSCASGSASTSRSSSQYGEFMVQIAHGDLGRSLVTNRPISADVAAVLPYTIELTLAALAHRQRHRRAARGRRGATARRLRRLARAHRLARRPVVPGLRLGHPAADRLRGRAALVPGDLDRHRLRPARAAARARAAGAQSRPDHGRLRHPRDPLRHAEGAVARTTSAPRAPRACRHASWCGATRCATC